MAEYLLDIYTTDDPEELAVLETPNGGGTVREALEEKIREAMKPILIPIARRIPGRRTKLVGRQLAYLCDAGIQEILANINGYNGGGVRAFVDKTARPAMKEKYDSWSPNTRDAA